MEHDSHCKEISDRLDAAARGDLYICPECGALTGTYDDDAPRCEECGARYDIEDAEQAGVCDVLADALDVEYTISARGEFRGARYAIAIGGPDIYVDTVRRRVELRWWSEYGDWPLSPEAVDAIDEIAEEDISAIFGRL